MPRVGRMGWWLRRDGLQWLRIQAGRVRARVVAAAGEPGVAMEAIAANAGRVGGATRAVAGVRLEAVGVETAMGPPGGATPAPASAVVAAMVGRAPRDGRRASWRMAPEGTAGVRAPAGAEEAARVAEVVRQTVTVGREAAGEDREYLRRRTGMPFVKVVVKNEEMPHVVCH